MMWDTLRRNMKGWNRRIFAIAGVSLVLVGILAWALRTQPIAADFAAVTRGEIVTTVDDEGESRVRDAYVVSAPVAGRLARIELEVGDAVVAQETILAVFQPQDPAVLDIRLLSEAEAGIRLAAADETRVRAELTYTRTEFERAETLANNGTISAAALDRARLAVRTAESALAQATALTAKRRNDLATARAAISNADAGGKQPGLLQVPVKAPVSGQVLRRMQQSAGLLAAGTPLLEIGDPAQLEIVTDYLSSDAVKVREGQPVIIDEWGGVAPLMGVVRRVEPFGFTKVSALGVEEQRVNIVIDITSPRETWNALGHGYRVLTRIVIKRTANALKVPVGALFRNGESWAVFVNDRGTAAGTARLRTVTVGDRNTLEAEIRDGLKEGETVLVHPDERIADGVRVATRR